MNQDFAEGGGTEVLSMMKEVNALEDLTLSHQTNTKQLSLLMESSSFSEGVQPLSTGGLKSRSGRKRTWSSESRRSSDTYSDTTEKSSVMVSSLSRRLTWPVYVQGRIPGLG